MITPLVMMIGGWFAYSILAIVWVLAAIGITLKLFSGKNQGGMSLRCILS
ncbi:MAG: hypothetical protein P8J00_11710 [Yoonia sp.]|nr:hypothetical protein [Yoonia sp.]